MYIDDFVLGSRSLKALKWLKDQVIRKFSMKDPREVKTIIEWEITQDLATGTLKIDQKGYIRDLLESEEITLYYPTVFLIKASSTFLLDQTGDHEQANLTKYQRLIRKLIYLNYRTYSDIAFVVRQLSCHNTNPQIEHLRISKQVLHYLKGTIMLGIEWGNNPAGH